jgi:hypothetical protein
MRVAAPQYITLNCSTLLDAHWCSCHIKLSVQLGKHKMTYENLAPPSQVQEKTYQLPGNGHASVLVVTSSGHKHGTVIHILSAVSRYWKCPMLRTVSTSPLLIYNLFYLRISIMYHFLLLSWNYMTFTQSDEILSRRFYTHITQSSHTYFTVGGLFCMLLDRSVTAEQIVITCFWERLN